MPKHLPGLPHWKRDNFNHGARRDDGLVLALDPWTDDGRASPAWRLYSHDGPYRDRIHAEQKNPNGGIVFTRLLSGRSITGIAHLVDESYPFDAVAGKTHLLGVLRQKLAEFETDELEPAEAAFKEAQQKHQRMLRECSDLMVAIDVLKKTKEVTS